MKGEIDMTILGIALMFVGVILIIGAFFSLVVPVVSFILSVIVRGLCGLFGDAYNSCMQNQDVRELIRQERIQKNIERAKKDRANDEQLNAEVNKVVQVAMKKYNELRAKYPLADDDLFNDFLDTYTTRPLQVSREIAEKIKEQHESRLQSNQHKEVRYQDLKHMKKLCEDEEYPITVAIYQDADGFYAVDIKNEVTGMRMAHATNNILIAKRIKAVALNRRRTMNTMRDGANSTSLTRVDVNNIINEVVVV